MANVFLSYARPDKDCAERLVAIFKADGLTVWCDRDIDTGRDFSAEIERQLEAAAVVVVLWSRHSVASRWVRDEASFAQDRGTLVPVRIEAVEPPLGLRGTQHLDLVGWKGHPDDQAVRSLCTCIHARLPPVPPVPPVLSAVPRRRRLAAGAGAALLAAAVLGGAYWDAYHALHTEHYANVAKRWGAPVGVGPLSADEVRHRHVSLAFIRRGRQGAVEEIRAVTSAGDYPPAFQSIPPLSLLGLLPVGNRAQVAGETWRVRFERDVSGRVVRQSGFSRDDRLLYELQYVRPDLASFHQPSGLPHRMTESGITHVRFVRPADGPDAGIDTKVLFQGSDGAPLADRDGSYGIVVTAADPRGLTLETADLGADGRPAPDRRGVAKVLLSYDTRGSLLSMSAIGEDGRPTAMAPGEGASQKFAYDRYGNLVELSTWDAQGRRTGSSLLGAAGRRFVYDEHGHVVETAFFGPDGQLARSQRVGFVMTRLRWIDKRTAIESYYGVDARPTAIDGRMVSARVNWDERGRMAGFTVLDGERPAVGADGCTTRRMGYDAQGNLSDLACLDAGGQPVRDTNGRARVRHLHDERGNAAESAYFQPNGQPGVYEQPYARVRRRFDEQSKLVQEAYFDAAGQPARHRDGYAAMQGRYDVHGNQVELSYLDEAGRPALFKGRYARVSMAYDTANRPVSRAAFDARGAPARDDNGVFMTRFTYDERGRLAQRAFFDAHDRPALDKSGCAMLVNRYSDANQIIEQSCHATDATPSVSRQRGISKTRLTYDARGRLVRSEYFDAQDRPALTRDGGYAAVEHLYDEAGREREQRHLDLAGAALPTCARVQEVEPGTKSQRVGLQAGDVLSSYDGQGLATDRHFQELELIRGERPRRLVIRRGGRSIDIDVPAGRLVGLEVMSTALCR